MNFDILKRYMTIKKTAYTIYLLENSQLKSPQIKSYCNLEKQKLLSVLSDEDKKIFINTLEFPFDLVLYKDFGRREIIADIDNNLAKFGISKELYTNKWKEYVKYSYGQLVDGNFDYRFIQISHDLYDIWNNKQDQNKNTNQINKNFN